MAMRPRTNEDRNRLAAHVAANRMVPYPTGGSEAQSELPNNQEYATEEDAAALGVTVDDIRRMLSNPSRYGGIYKPSASRDGVSEEVKNQPAVDNAKRTTSRTGADGKATGTKTKLPASAPPPPSRPAEEDGWGTEAAIAAALGAAGYGAYKYATRSQGKKEMPADAKGGPEGDVVDRKALEGPLNRKMLAPPGVADAAEELYLDPATGKWTTKNGMYDPGDPRNVSAEQDMYRRGVPQTETPAEVRQLTGPDAPKMIEGRPAQLAIESRVPDPDDMDRFILRQLNMDSPGEVGPAAQQGPVRPANPATDLPPVSETPRPNNLSPEMEETVARVIGAVRGKAMPRGRVKLPGRF